MIITIILIVTMFLGGIVLGRLKPSKSLTVSKDEKIKRLARLEALGNNAIDIERFIVKYVECLDEETMNVLISRIEMLKADSIINEDTLLKSRIDDDYTKKRVAEEEVINSLEELFQPEQKVRKKRNVKKSG